MITSCAKATSAHVAHSDRSSRRMASSSVYRLEPHARIRLDIAELLYQGSGPSQSLKALERAATAILLSLLCSGAFVNCSDFSSTGGRSTAERLSGEMLRCSSGV